jgi:hypothetical protein
MLIVDGQIHLWEKGTPSPQHRQEPYSAEQAIAALDQAGVERALIYLVLWDPDSNELAIEAVRKYPAALRHHGVVLSRPAEWSRPRRALERAAGHARSALLFPCAFISLGFYFNERHKREWMTDGASTCYGPRPSGPACRWRSPPPGARHPRDIGAPEHPFGPGGSEDRGRTPAGGMARFKPRGQ